MVQAGAQGHFLEATQRVFMHTPDRETSNREKILAYVNNQYLGCLKERNKKVHISLHLALPRSITTCKTRIETGSNGNYLVTKADGPDIDNQNIVKSINKYMAGWQRDVLKKKIDQGKSAAYKTATSNNLLSGPTRLMQKLESTLCATSYASIPKKDQSLKGIMLPALHR